MTIKHNAILVVDDDPYVLESISTLLRAFGFTVNTCDNANSAIKEIQRTAVDVVLTDVKMPVLTGVMPQLKTRARHHRALVADTENFYIMPRYRGNQSDRPGQYVMIIRPSTVTPMNGTTPE